VITVSSILRPFPFLDLMRLLISSFQESHSHSLLSARQATKPPQNPFSPSTTPSRLTQISPHLNFTSSQFHLISFLSTTKMQKKLRLSLAATHLALCAHILDLLPPLPSSLQHHLSLLSPWLLALGIPLLILISHPKVPGQFDGMLAWAAGALFVNVYRNCGVRSEDWGGGDREGDIGIGELGEGMCSNSAVAEMVFLGLSVGMILKRCW